MNTPTKTPLTEKQQKRLAMLQSMAGTPQQRRAARFIRPILVLLLGGAAFFFGGLMTYNSSEQQLRPDSWAYQHLGNHGLAVLMCLAGMAMITGGILLLRKVRLERLASEAQSR